jgi:Flp pilus assembly protein TadG
MWRMMRRARGNNSERGAVVVLVSILLVTGVLVGFGALVVDTGQIYSERAQLQNGADAAALAVALGCSKSPTACPPTDDTIATKYATANYRAIASGQSTVIDVMCGADSAGTAWKIDHTAGTVACPRTSTDASHNCSSKTVPTKNFVEVHTRTQSSDASHHRLLPPVFGRALLGSSYSGAAVTACARTTSDGLGAYTGLGITISKCEWNTYTNNDAHYATAPYLAKDEVLLYLHAPQDTPGIDCPAGSANQDVPGGFGFTLSDSGKSGCQTAFTVDGKYAAATGWNPKCESFFATAIGPPSVPVIIPIYGSVVATAKQYQVWGFASFVMTGYWKGSTFGSALPGSKYIKKSDCPNATWCISGLFTSTTTVGEGGGPLYGANVVKLAG